VEVVSDTFLLVDKEVGQSSLLDEVVLLVNANIFHLFFSVDQPSGLDFFSDISPLVAHLLGLVTRVDVVENGKLGTEQEGEVTGLSVSNVPAHEELVVEDESTEPFVVGP